jgi:hypothetical protein
MNLGGTILNFDLGGFTGGIIGTLGAFLSAFFIFKKEQSLDKPRKDKDRYIMANSINKEISNLQIDLIYKLSESQAILTKSVNDTMYNIAEYLPEAIMTDKELVEIIHTTKEDILDFNEMWAKQFNTEKSDYVFAVNGYLHKISVKCNKITEEIINDNLPKDRQLVLQIGQKKIPLAVWRK